MKAIDKAQEYAKSDECKAEVRSLMRDEVGLKSYGHTVQEYLESAEKYLFDIFKPATTHLIGSMQLESDGKSTFLGVAAKRDKSMTDICCSVIRKYQDPLAEVAGQVEMNEANKPLTKALDALRNSKDLLTQVSKKAE